MKCRKTIAIEKTIGVMNSEIIGVAISNIIGVMHLKLIRMMISKIIGMMMPAPPL